jgi:hypothetical protein
MKKINELFDLLDDWRLLPSYQLERRADIYFAIHLEPILKASRSKLVSEHRTMGIIPEFPILKRIIDNEESSNLSFKVDYAVFFESSAKFILVELKTDIRSIDKQQYEKLKKVQQEVELQDVIEGINTVYKRSKSKYRVKYKYLLEKLRSFGIVDHNFNFNKDLNQQKANSELFYLMPGYDNKNIVPKVETITFDDVKNGLSQEKDPLTIRFCKSLIPWAEPENGL